MDRVTLLDHGYVELIESWGSEEQIIEAARQSTAKGFLGWGLLKCRWCDVTSESGRLPDTHCPGGRGGAHENHDGFSAGDEKLLRYLWEHQHSSPFEFAGLVIEAQIPIFVARELMRHRTMSFSELSARYAPVPDVNYVPTLERCMMGSDGKNKQAGTVKGALPLTESAAEEWRAQVDAFYAHAEALYQSGLKSGLPKELARVVMPVGRYSRMRASANLRNWLGFLSLRMAPDAQWEIRMFANAVGEMVAAKFPRTWELFSEGQR